ncbi:YigZ family protein [Nocardioides caldifontis]|uniref:YigZ family protein n=1 Tax=Nocardioides caldifontis TaxID=2588938 RepID=UPI0011DFCF08|nr:YigZ family protein [Nocardioides caldifontis]
MSVTSYFVPARTAEAEIEVKRSRFLCRVERVATEEAARAVVEAARRQHWDARHHCSAFVLGPTGTVARSADDGEPAGTAGAPMLEVLRGAGVSDAVVVVTRWFGGVLLGAGGLVRAYGEAVREGLAAAGTREQRLLELVVLEVGHAEAGRVENDLRSRGVVVRDVAYGPSVTMVLAAPPGAPLDGVVAEATGGNGVLRPAGTEWVDR